MLSILRLIMERTLPIAGFDDYKLGDVLRDRAYECLHKTDDIPDEILDQMLGGKPNLITMSDWRVYSERKSALRKYLRNAYLSPSLNPKIVK